MTIQLPISDWLGPVTITTFTLEEWVVVVAITLTTLSRVVLVGVFITWLGRSVGRFIHEVFIS